DLGARTATSAGKTDAFVAELDLDGTVGASFVLGGNDYDNIQVVAPAPDGDVFVLAGSDGGLDPGGGTLVGGMFVRRYSTSGPYRWAQVEGNSTAGMAATPEPVSVAFFKLFTNDLLERYTPDGSFLGSTGCSGGDGVNVLPWAAAANAAGDIAIGATN